MGSIGTQDFKVGLIRTPPPNWPLPLENRDWTGITINIEETIDKALCLIQEAKTNGAELVAFPELWFPGFPKWREQNDWNKTHLSQYLDNALVIGSPQWTRLIEGIKSISIWTALAFAERRDDRLHMAQALISPEGEVVHHRHKLRPSGSERDMFSDGDISMLKVVDTAIGRVGMLQCGEHFYPSMTFPMAAQRPKLHIGCFPFTHDEGDDKDSLFYNSSLIIRGSGSYALISGAYILMPSIGYSFIYNPLAQIVASVDNTISWDETPILYHTLDGTELHSAQTYDPDAQASWGILEQLNESFPKHIPHEQGSLTPGRWTSVKKMHAQGVRWSEIAPGTPWPEDLEH